MAQPLSPEQRNKVVNFLGKEISSKMASQPKVGKIRPCRIKINGEFIKTSSGKTLWRRKGDAKSALRLHVEDAYNACFKRSWNPERTIESLDLQLTSEDFYRLREELVQHFYDIAEFVEVDP